MRRDYVSKLEKYSIVYWSEQSITWDPKCDVFDDYWTDTGKLNIKNEAETKAIEATM